MKTTTTTLLTAFFASPAFAHADASPHIHGLEVGTVLAAAGLLLAVAAIAWWANLR